MTGLKTVSNTQHRSSRTLRRNGRQGSALSCDERSQYATPLTAVLAAGVFCYEKIFFSCFKNERAATLGQPRAKAECNPTRRRGIIFLSAFRGGSSSMVEHRLPKPVVAGSIPVSRSSFFAEIFRLAAISH